MSPRKVVELIPDFVETAFLLGIHVHINVDRALCINAFHAIAVDGCPLGEIAVVYVDGQPALVPIQLRIDEIAMLIGRDARLPIEDVVNYLRPEAPVRVQVT